MNSYVVNLYPVPNPNTTGQNLDIDGTVVSFANTLDPKTTCCMVTITKGDVYVTFDGTTPSSSNGNEIDGPATLWWSKETVRAAKFLSASGTVVHARLSQFSY